jgi:hypothetical protein
MTKNEKLIASLTKDLVKLAVKTNKLLMVAQIPAAYAEEAYEILTACKSIYSEFAVEDKQASK